MWFGIPLIVTDMYNALSNVLCRYDEMIISLWITLVVYALLLSPVNTYMSYRVIMMGGTSDILRGSKWSREGYVPRTWGGGY